MPGLDKNALKSDLLSLVTDMRTREEVSDEEFCTRMSDAIDSYVKGAVIKYTGGLNAPDGPVTGTFQGNLE